MVLLCYNALKRMEHRPTMWTGENSLRSMATYVQGYKDALGDNNLIAETDLDDPFFDWVAGKLGYFESTAGWANMILAYSLGFDPRLIEWEQFLARPVSGQEHSRSIELFYNLLDEFKEKESTR